MREERTKEGEGGGFRRRSSLHKPIFQCYYTPAHSQYGVNKWSHK